MRYKPKSIAALQLALGGLRLGHRNIREDRRPTSQSRGVGREFGDADAVISASLGVVVLGQPLAPVQVAGVAPVIVALIGATVQMG
jgi:hypothetical protein